MNLPPLVLCCGILWSVFEETDDAVRRGPGYGASFDGRCGKCGKVLEFLLVLVPVRITTNQNG